MFSRSGTILVHDHILSYLKKLFDMGSTFLSLLSLSGCHPYPWRIEFQETPWRLPGFVGSTIAVLAEGLGRFSMWVFPRIRVPQNGSFINVYNGMKTLFFNGWFGDTMIFGNSHVDDNALHVSPEICQKEFQTDGPPLDKRCHSGNESTM